MSIKESWVESKPSIRGLDEKPQISSVFIEFRVQNMKISAMSSYGKKINTFELHIEHLINIVSQDRYFQIRLKV